MCDSLIITLVLHPKFGYMLLPVFATYNEDLELYTITETARISSTAYKDLSLDEQSIVDLGERYTDRGLMNSFSKKKIEADFLDSVSAEEINIHIRPFIERKQEKLVELARKTKTPLFFREKISVRDFRIDKAIEILQTPSTMVFHFSQTEIFTYHATIRNGLSNVVLYNQFFAPLVSSPAVAVIGRQLHYFTDVDVKKLKPFFNKKQIEVPQRSVPEYIRTFVMQCVKNFEVKAEGFSVFEQTYRPKAVLTLETDFDLQPALKLQFHYGARRFAIDRPYKKEVELVDENGVLSIGWYYRDKAWEKEHISMLEKGGLLKSRTNQFYVDNQLENKILQNRTRNLNHGDQISNHGDQISNQETDSSHQEDLDKQQDGQHSRQENIASHQEAQNTALKTQTYDSLGLIEWINQNGELLSHFELKQSLGQLVYYTGEMSLQLSVNEKNDWFDLHSVVRFDDVEIPFMRFKEHILNGIREFVLPDGRIAVLPLAWFSRFGEMFRYGKVSGNQLSLHKYHFRVKELAENGDFPELADGQMRLDIAIPDTLNATLRPYQENGFRWLAYLQKKGFGGCLADDMGLGKTVQVIALFLHLYTKVSEHQNTNSNDFGQLNGTSNVSETSKGTSDVLKSLSAISDVPSPSGGTPDDSETPGEILTIPKSINGTSNVSAPFNAISGKKSGQPRQLSLFDLMGNAVDEGVGEWSGGDNRMNDEGNAVTGTENDKVQNKPGQKSVVLKTNLPPSLVVVPTSLVHNWLNELKKFAPILNVYVHAGGNRLQNEGFREEAGRSQVILTTYGIVRQDIGLLRHSYFHYVVLDESQNIKNPESQIFNCVKQLQSTYKLTMTGTPVENSLSDLWSQMDFLNDRMLGKHNNFKRRFSEADVIRDEESRHKLLKIIDPFILRRTKEEVAPELPPLTEETIYCEMGEMQAILYNEEKNKIRNALLEQMDAVGRPISVEALSSLMRLRLLANHPSISLPGYEGGSAKFEQIISQAETIFSENHKVLIFSSFVKHLQLFADYFDGHGWRYAWLTGQTTNREAEINKFNTDEEVKAFFISLKAGGTGLNLTTADYVFIIDPWWNPAAEMQAVGRAHRIGQERNVTLYRFISKGTVEEKIQQLQLYKKTLTDAVVKPQLSMKEIQELLV